MKKTLVSIIIIFITFSIIGLNFVDISISHCEGNGPCCQKSCDCPADGCFFAGQFSFIVEPLQLVDKIVLTESVSQFYVYDSSQECIRSIFHPPEYL